MGLEEDDEGDTILSERRLQLLIYMPCSMNSLLEQREEGKGAREISKSKTSPL